MTTKYAISVANDNCKNDSPTTTMLVDVACRRELCCTHSNTFFTPSSATPCHPFMATVSIKYIRPHEEEIKFRATRTTCLPFPPFHIKCFLCTESAYPTIVIQSMTSNITHRLTSRDLNTVDSIIENMVSVDMQPIQRVDHLIKAHRHRMCARVRMHPYPINVCAKAFVKGGKCELNQECARTNVAIEQKANLNKGIEVNSK